MTSEVPENHDNNLSQYCSSVDGRKTPEDECNELEDVFEVSNDSDNKSQDIECDFAFHGNKMKDSDKTSHHGYMKGGERFSDLGHHHHDLAPMDRPRSFSDVSASSSGPGLLQRLQGRLDRHKTAMKVFVRRESKVISGAGIADKHCGGGDAGDLAVAAGFDAGGGGGVHSQYGQLSQLPLMDRPEKSASVDDILNTDADRPPPKPKLPDNYRQYLDKQLRHFHHVHGKSLDSAVPDSLVEKKEFSDLDNVKYRTKLGKPGLIPENRKSVHELPMRRSSVIYKHYDAKFQSELLRIELEKLRAFKHVRKNSATMKQKFESILQRPKSTSDAHVRFSEDMEDSEPVSKAAGSLSDRPTLVKQSASLETSPEYVKQGDGYSSGPEGRRRAFGRGGQEPTRSKSATALSRNKADLGHDGSEDQGQGLRGQKGSQLSKSASNLRRQPETIRRYNASSLQHVRDNVRQKYERGTRVESMSPNDPGMDLELEMNRARQRLETQGRLAPGDNRSDEEKYAALSRNKTVYSKSGPQRRDKYGREIRGGNSSQSVTSSDPSGGAGQVVRQTALVKPNVVRAPVSESAQENTDGAGKSYVHLSSKPGANADLYSRSSGPNLKGAIMYNSNSVPNVSSKDYKSYQSHAAQSKDQSLAVSNSSRSHPTHPSKSYTADHSQLKDNLTKDPKASTSKGNVNVNVDLRQPRKARDNSDIDQASFWDAKKPIVAQDSVVIDARAQGARVGSGNIVLRQCRVGSDVVFGLVSVAAPAPDRAVAPQASSRGQTQV